MKGVVSPDLKISTLTGSLAAVNVTVGAAFSKEWPMTLQNSDLQREKEREARQELVFVD